MAVCAAAAIAAMEMAGRERNWPGRKQTDGQPKRERGRGTCCGPALFAVGEVTIVTVADCVLSVSVFLLVVVSVNSKPKEERARANYLKLALALRDVI